MQITHGFVGVQRAPTEYRVRNHQARNAALWRERFAEGAKQAPNSCSTSPSAALKTEGP